MTESSRSQLIRALWSPDLPAHSRVWTILDAARDAGVYRAYVETSQPKCCLFAGALAPELQLTAPYLIQLDDDQFTRSLLDQAWGNSWGIFLRTDVDQERLRKHLRTFLRVKDQTGRYLLFRYYDPRVMRLYLPTCLLPELKQVFGPVQRYLMESAQPEELLQFRMKDTELEQRTIALAPVASASR